MTAGDANIEAIYPLTPVQEGILFHTLYAPQSPLYFQQYTCRLDGALDPAAFARSWQHVIDRHPALRALITWEGRDQPLQIIRSRLKADWHQQDWRAHSPDDQAGRLEQFLESDRGHGFQLDMAPLMRFALFRTGDTTHRFVWSHHHIIIDGWSMGLVLDEVFRSYEALVSGEEPELAEPAGYRQYVRWLKDQDPGPAEQFWRNELSGFGAATSLRLGDVQSGVSWAERHGEESLRLSADASSRLADFARSQGLTLNTLVRGAWAMLLSRYSGEDDVVFGATLSGRPPELVDSLDMVGLFINTLPVRVRLRPDQPLGSWLHHIQERQVEAGPYESTALVDVQGWSAIRGGGPLFETLLVFENVPAPATGSGGWTTSDLRYLQRSNYPLAVLVMPGDELEFIFLYDADRFDPSIIRRMIRQLACVLEAMDGDPQRPLGAIDFFPEAELNEMLHDWNATDADYPADRTIHQLIDDVTKASPDVVAVTGSGTSLTYAELDARAAIVARRLRIIGVEPGDRVGVSLDRTSGMIVGILGVLKAGGAYVPLDPGLPPMRSNLLLDETSARALIAGVDSDTAVGHDPAIPVLRVDGAGELGEADEEPQIDPAGAATTATDLAYVLYTSGSTGRPKGVAVTHRNLVNSTHARLDAYSERVGAFLLLSPFVFDSSVVGIFATLTQGGTLVLPAPRMEQDVHHLAQLITGHMVTHTLALPTLYDLLLEVAEPDALRSLKLVMVAGEPCPPSLVAKHYARLPHTKLVNEYGPTEATVWCTVHHIDPPSAEEDDRRRQRRVPIGRPISNTKAYILDRYARPVPVGVPGELHIGGPGIATGNLGRPELTAEHFVERNIPGSGMTRLYRTGDIARFLPDGSIDLLGRSDHQVKIRGQRVELEEIAQVLEEHPSVREAIAVVTGEVARADLGASATVVAYIEGGADPVELRAFVADRLPDAMVPAIVVPLESLPRGANGKVDRRALPEAVAPATGEVFVPPSGEMENELAAIWTGVLGLEFVGATDNFFELGGDSILSIRVIARAHQAGLSITPKQFFDAPTIAGLVASVETGSGRC